MTNSIEIERVIEIRFLGVILVLMLQNSLKSEKLVKIGSLFTKTIRRFRRRGVSVGVVRHLRM